MSVYLLHFEKPISDRHTCQHYLGYADDVTARVNAHRTNRGARLTAVANERGITYTVVKIWPDGDRTFERKLKNQKNSRQFCPICQHQVAHMHLERDVNSYER
jgi:predicted GIY-YIG superfamily endonuclease